MSKLNLLGLEFIIVSIVLSVMLYKLEISKRIIDEDYEYIKKHRVFGDLTCRYRFCSRSSSSG